MRTRTLLGIGAALTCAGMAALWSTRSQAADEVKLVIPAARAPKVIDDDIKELQKALALPKVEKRDQRRVRILAILIAQNAAGLHATGAGDKGALSGQYATAVEILEALNKDDGLSEAQKAAGKFAGAKGDSLKAVDLTKYLLDDNKDPDYDTSMHLYKSTRAGGLGIEKLVKDFSEKNPAAKDLPAIASAANRAAAITGYLEHLPPKQEMGPKTKAAWQKFVQDARASALETAAAAEKKNIAGTKAGLAKMDVSCVGCHDVFKP